MTEQAPAQERSARQNFRAWLATHAASVSNDCFPPRYLNAVSFPPLPEERAAAWELHVELRTRIATQALPLHSGDESAALKSLFQLFDRARTTLAKHGPNAASVGTVVMAALNEDVRPVTAYWHGLGEGRFAQPDEAGDFRADLRALQAQLQILTDFLGYVARGADYVDERMVTAPPACEVAPTPLPATTTLPELADMEEAERASIEARRKCMFELPGEMPDPAPAASTRGTGLALSGGGIRSATFSLGVLTALSRAGLYRQFDYLSTVSGGGYVGTMLSTWATSKEAEKTTKEGLPDAATRAELAEGPFSDDRAVEHLRDRSRYLVDGGISGMARAVVPILLGILASSAMLVATTVVTLPLAVLGVAAGAWARDNAQPAAVAAGVTLAMILLTWRIRQARRRLSRPLVVTLVVAAALAAPALGIGLVDATREALEWAAANVWSHVGDAAEGLLAAVPVVMTAIAHLLKRGGRRSARIGWYLLAASPWVAYALALTLVYHWLTPAHWSSLGEIDLHSREIHWWGAALVAAVAVILLADVNENSPRGYYRDRLAETYCVETKGDRVVRAKLAPTLQALGDYSPIHLINTTVNLPATRARNDRGRGAAPLVFSKHGWLYPAVVQDGAEDSLRPAFVKLTQAWMGMDVATAMAISGAAVAPLMGTSTPTGASPWLTLLNFRLSYWLRNPAKPQRALFSIPWGFYLLRELTGRVHERSWRINVSDGGHFENLGIYELLRRKCEHIVAIDGEADGDLRCGGLMNIVRLARIDFGADVRIDVRKLRLDGDRFSRAHMAIGHIRYRDGSLGTLLYVKLSVTGDEPGHLLAYRENEPSFPHHSTADQIFSEEQFESYRALGQHIGECLFRSELAGAKVARCASERAANRSGPRVDLGDWLGEIKKSLARDLPSEHAKKWSDRGRVGDQPVMATSGLAVGERAPKRQSAAQPTSPRPTGHHPQPNDGS